MSAGLWSRLLGGKVLVYLFSAWAHCEDKGRRLGWGKEEKESEGRKRWRGGSGKQGRETETEKGYDQTQGNSSLQRVFRKGLILRRDAPKGCVPADGI